MGAADAGEPIAMTMAIASKAKAEDHAVDVALGEGGDDGDFEEEPEAEGSVEAGGRAGRKEDGAGPAEGRRDGVHRRERLHGG